MINVLESNFCNSKSIMTIFNFLGIIMDYILIFVPIMLIIIFMFQLIKCIISPSNDKKIRGQLVKKIIISISIFFINPIVHFILTTINSNYDNKCLMCFEDPKKCSTIIEYDNNLEICNNKNTLEEKDDCCKSILGEKAKYSSLADCCVKSITNENQY